MQNIADVTIADGRVAARRALLARDKQWAVREGDWKLVVNGPASTRNGNEIPAQEVFLSNLAEDPGESRNLAAEKPEIVARLAQIHEKWVEDVQRQ